MSLNAAAARPQSANTSNPPRYDLSKFDARRTDLMTPWEENPTGTAIQVLVYRRLIEAWMPYLSPAEFVVMAFILRYTAGMGRKGAHDRGRLSAGFHYKQIANATGLSRTTVERAIGRLKELGFITVNNGDNRQCLIVTPDLNWMAYKDTLPAFHGRRALAAKRKPKKASPVSTWANPPLPRGDPYLLQEETSRLFQEETPHLFQEVLLECKEEDKKEDLEDTGLPAAPATRSTGGPEVPSSSVPVSVRVRVRQRAGSLPAKKEPPQLRAAPPASDIAEPMLPLRLETASRQFTDEERAADRARQLQTVRTILKPGALEKTYRAAFEDAYGDQPGVFALAWTHVQLAKIGAVIVKKWPAGAAEDCHDYIAWVVMNFSRLRRQVFGWMKKPEAPVAPNADFLARWHGDLLKAYQKRRQEQNIECLDSHEERKLAHLTLVQGKSPEEALISIAEDRAALKLRDEIEAGKAEATRRLRAAQLAEQAAAKKPMGIHPRSEVAMRLRELEAKMHKKAVDPNEPIDLMAALEEGERRAREDSPAEAKTH
ncbi:MAG: helix-turn-helix domain-containing protein [Mesorhizobium sp.]|uniref:helix-turn-helix domain-containing protein n=1 Tax=Mesorhizobium sp. TaxID=1871066 RepID=UPI00121600EE|nr:winged helix-turn-helix transcriptional regulator [Mesorhizobium sp.]TIR25958.1 MAG: helix-turn-helix domain-containing protein [Mesorhizobium sp.]